MIVCSKCGNKAQDGAIFCDQCGNRLVEQEPVAGVASTAPAPVAAPVAAPSNTLTCPSCGFSNVPGEAFCENCGTKLAALEPESAPAPAPVTAAPVVAAPEPAVPAAAAPAEAAPAAGKVCPACGAAASPDDDFCYACGADLRAPADAAAASAVPAAPAGTAAPVPAAPVEAAPAPAPVAAAPVAKCPACGAAAKEGAAFCDVCGATLAAAPAPQPATPAPTPAPGGGPRLIVVASGVEIPLPAKAELLVGREDPVSNIFPDVDLSPHGGEEGGVSRRHFKITVQGSQYSIEDLNSTNHTLLNRAKLDPGVKRPLADGDEVRAGRVRLVFKAS